MWLWFSFHCNKDTTTTITTTTTFFLQFSFPCKKSSYRIHTALYYDDIRRRSIFRKREHGCRSQRTAHPFHDHLVHVYSSCWKQVRGQKFAIASFYFSSINSPKVLLYTNLVCSTRVQISLWLIPDIHVMYIQIYTSIFDHMRVYLSKSHIRTSDVGCRFLWIYCTDIAYRGHWGTLNHF